MNWGIIGYGEITPQFIEGLMSIQGNELIGIASISKYQMLQEEGKYPTAQIYRDYQTLLCNPDIDVVYINTVNNLHKKNVLSALQAQKNVLCEKPMGLSWSDTEEMIIEARKRGKFLMEGMWTRFLPAYRHFKSILSENVIGNVNFVKVDFGFFSNWDDHRRLKNPELFGGTLLDNADYGLFLCQDIFKNKPTTISATARYYKTGVEDMCAVTLQYQDGALAQLFSSFQQKTNQEALIYGDKGHIHLKSFWNGTLVELHTREESKYWNFSFEGSGFQFEIQEVTFCISNGQIESPIIPHSTSLNVAETMDVIIKQIRK